MSTPQDIEVVEDRSKSSSSKQTASSKMPAKREQIALQEEVSNQEQWDDLMMKENMIVVDVYQKWCGPCLAVASLFRRLKNELGDDLLKFAVSECDSIEALEKYRGRCEPCFLFFSGGQLVDVVRGAKGPVLQKAISAQLAAEHRVQDEGAERKVIKDPYLAQFEDAEKETAEAEDEEKRKEEEEARSLVKLLPKGRPAYPKKLFCRLLRTTKLLVEQRLKPRSEAFRSLRASIKERKPATHFQGMTKKLLQETNEHFTKMVNTMVRDFSVPSTCSARLWTCYERCVFPEISVDIMKVYKEAYKIEMKQLRHYLPTVSITDLGLDDEWILNILGLYAPSSLTQGFGLDEPGSHRNSYDDDDDEGNQTSMLNGQSKSIPETCPIRTMVETLEIYNPNPHQIKGDASKDELSPEQLKANLERFEQLRTQNLEELDQSDFELSTRSEPPQSSPSVVRRRKKEKSGAQTWTRRGTKVLGAKWITPPPRSKSFCASERPKSDKDEALAVSLPSMLEAEERMSSIVGPASIPIDIPFQRGSDATTAADSGVCCESFSVSEGASYRNSTENTNNCRHKHDEGLSTNDVSIMMTAPPLTESSTEEIIEEHLAKRRSDPYVAAFLERFRTAYYCFRVVLQESVPTAKFQWLCKCLKEVNDVAEKQAQLIFCGKRRMLCGDDLLTTLILFVLHGEPDEMVQAYPQLKFMEDYLPEFLDKGQFGFSVYQFLFAFQYILDKYEAMRQLNEECKGST